MKYLIFFLVISPLKILGMDDQNFPEIIGCFCEGGLIYGEAKKNDEIIIDNNKIKVSSDGYFIFAFGRKFQKDLNLSINGIDKIFKIKDQKYKIEIINNLASNKVEPNQKEIQKILRDKEKIQLAKKKSEDKKLFKEDFIFPAKGRISGVFGSQRILNKKPRRPHYGIDIAAPKGTRIVSPANGRVSLVEKDMFFTGNTVIIDHGLGLISIFAHLHEINLSEGEYVTTGTLIGSIGQTGRATGPHLHWGVYLGKKPVDPNILITLNKIN
ncbi:M23 family metallopeptidase [Rickettsiales bacterium]|nr:M23 family metallopeptidase [Rickettsiales bacterium]